MPDHLATSPNATPRTASPLPPSLPAVCPPASLTATTIQLPAGFIMYYLVDF
jgi:hypothetical protein